MTEFEEFKQRTERENDAQAVREGYASGDPNQIQSARNYAVNSLNDIPDDELPFPRPESPAEQAQIRESNASIESLLVYHGERTMNRARGHFTRQKDAIIDQAPDDKLARNCLHITPKTTGDPTHDAIVQEHIKYAKLSSLARSYETEPQPGEEKVKHSDLINAVSSHVAKEVDRRLQNVEDVTDKEKKLAKQTALTILGASEAYALRMAKAYAETGKKAVEQALPDERARAEYARANLRAEQDIDKARANLYAATR